MSRTAGPFTVDGPSAPIVVQVPAGYASDNVTLINSSGFACMITTGAVDQAWLAPWAQITYPVGPGRNNVTVTPVTSPVAAPAGQLLVTFHDPNETPPLDAFGGPTVVDIASGATVNLNVGATVGINGQPIHTVVDAGTVGISGQPLSVTGSTVALAGQPISTNQTAVDGTAVDVNTGVPTAGTQRVVLATPATILAGYQSFTATTGATTLVTVPAGKTWTGTVAVSAACAEAAAGVAQPQALGVISTAGAGAVPAAGSYFAVEALSGANAATGLVGSGAANFGSLPMIVTAPAGNSVTIQVTVTIAGTAGRVDASAFGTTV